MSTELYGLFENQDQAETAKQELIVSGFDQNEIKTEDYEAKDGTAQILLTVNAAKTPDRQKVFGILAKSGAASLDRKQPKPQSSLTPLEDDGELASPAEESSVSGVL